MTDITWSYWQYQSKKILLENPLPRVGEPMPERRGRVTEVKQVKPLEYLIRYEATLDE